MIQGVQSVATITMKSKLLIVINAKGSPSLRRENSLQPSVKSRNDKEMAGCFLSNASPTGKIECTNIKIMRQARIAFKNMAA